MQEIFNRSPFELSLLIILVLIFLGVIWLLRAIDSNRTLFLRLPTVRYRIPKFVFRTIVGIDSIKVDIERYHRNLGLRQRLREP